MQLAIARQEQFDWSASRFLQELSANAVIDDVAAARVLAAHAKTGESLCRLLPRLGIIEERTLAQHLGAYLSLAILTEAAVPLDPVAADQLSERFLQEELILPIAISTDRIVIAVGDPFNDYAMKAVALASGRAVELVIGEISLIERILRQRNGEAEEQVSAGVEENGRGDDDDGDLQKLRDLAAEAPVIRLVNQLIQSAVDMRASDIHLEPFQHVFQVRYRIDGLLREVPAPPANLRAAIVSRIKVMAKLNIAERRLPQDGRIRMTVRGKDVDLRVSTFPTLYGESIVLRVLDRLGVVLDLDRLGFSAGALATYLNILRRPTGMVLVTGPTGSGKTTSLYASLLHLNSAEQKIFTVEDPIEYELPGINQTQVKPQVGLTFASSLRSLVRQDPDVILIGEIRDLETAEIAGQSSLTGHKVLSTLHTNDAVSTVTRLRDMGVPNFLVSATLECVIAQRLVRVLCAHCKSHQPPASILLEAATRLDVEPKSDVSICVPRGCDRCNGTGYRGRTGIYEMLVISDDLRGLIHREASTGDLRHAAKDAGMRSMFADGLRQVFHGTTTLEEVQRVTSEV